MIDASKIREDMVYIHKRTGCAMRVKREGAFLSCKEIGEFPTAMMVEDAAEIRSATMREQRDFWRKLAFALMDEIEGEE